MITQDSTMPAGAGLQKQATQTQSRIHVATGLICTFLLLLGLMFPPVSSANNVTEISPYTDQIYLTQINQGNTAAIVQGWGGISALLSNLAIVEQIGENNLVLVWQVGLDNTAGVVQHGWNNISLSLQAGNHNSASISQFGDDNRALTWQLGDDNQTTVTQYGNDNLIRVLQDGGKTLTITQFAF